MKSTHRKNDGALVLRKNGGWLRYLFWGAAIGMCFVVAAALASPVRDWVKIIASALGVLFFDFCGFALQVRRITIDPSTREITISSKGFRHQITERLKFEEIKKILVLPTMVAVENVRGAEVMRKRWSIAFVLDGRSVPVTKNEYVTKNGVMRDAKKIRKILGVEISDAVEEGIEHLAQNGKKTEAVMVASRVLGMTTSQAKDFVERGTAKESG